MSRKQEEFRLHCWVCDMLDRFAQPNVVIYHTPNGEYRTAATARRLARMKVLPGVADLTFVTAGARVSYLELKAKGGQLSPAQRAFKSAVEALGCRYALADSGPQAIDILTSWGVLEGVQVQ